MATVPGIDVSYWNAGIDWPKVRATGQRFVFAKASEGSSYSDPPSTITGAARNLPDS
jgi:GH25 family lysozyme M1 (1,4-beta-N-acetylmuramidase)